MAVLQNVSSQVLKQQSALSGNSSQKKTSFWLPRIRTSSVERESKTFHTELPTPAEEHEAEERPDCFRSSNYGRSLAQTAEARAAQAQEALDKWGIFRRQSKEDESDEKSPQDNSGCRKTFKKPGGKAWLWIFAVLVSLVSVSAGVGVQLTEASQEGQYAFKWCYFLGGMVPLALASRFLANRAFHYIEVIFFQEFLAHYDSLKRATGNLLACGLVLLWHSIVFRWAWCGDRGLAVCEDSTYQNVVGNTTRALACVFLAAVATFLATGITRAMSTHFYMSTHVRKLHEALEQEFQLRVLSKPRQRRKKASKPMAFRRQSSSRGPSSPKAAQKGPRNKAPFKDGSRLVSGIVLDMPKAATAAAAAVTQRSHSDSGPAQAPASDHERRHNREPSWGNMSVASDESGEVSICNSSSEEPQRASALGTTWETDRQVILNINKEVLGTIPLGRLGKQDVEEIEELPEREIERIRTAVVIKTYSNLVRQHRFRTAEEMEQQIGEVKTFGAALFNNIRGNDLTRKFITVHDVRLFYKDDKAGKEQAAKAFAMFSPNCQAEVSKQEVVDAVLGLFRQRSDIAASLANTDSMMNSLETGFAGAFHFLFIGLYLVIWNIDFVQGFSTFSATVLALSFIFGNSIRNTFEAMLFLFVQHPYDVGDWIEFDGQIYVVRKISLLHTCFVDIYDRQTTLANAVLVSKGISNLTRSTIHTEYVTIAVDVGMAPIVKHNLTSRMKQLFKMKPTEFSAESVDVKYSGMLEHGLKMKLLILWTYAMAPDDWRRKRNARDDVLEVVSDVLQSHASDGARYTFHQKLDAPLAPGGTTF